ncbi:hypothetical protein RB653_000891 [Dictyostelium firmibasis]|uniref:NADP-dependent oxidoreductase domain-containing protein n=1 Tax=Dictyostelium firmibasis TaxID=79012 RepID=A0AAN7YY94_9MYCE
MSSSIKSTIKLNNGINIPVIGLGTYLTEDSDIEQSVRSAIEQGYRHIDTASYYKNEKKIGDTIKQLIKEGVVKREELFITTKVGTWQHGYENALKAFEESLEKLQLDYLDCYLIHYPGTYSELPKGESMSSLRSKTWKALEKLYNDGKVRSIGVSNYTESHLHELLSQCTIKPVMNQVEFHPYLFQESLLNYCKSNDIVLEAYGSLAGGNEILTEPVVLEISNQINKTPAQLLLKWAIQNGLIVIPKSIKSERVIENSLLDFEISQENIKKLNLLNKNKRFYWDPNNVN